MTIPRAYLRGVATVLVLGGLGAGGWWAWGPNTALDARLESKTVAVSKNTPPARAEMEAMRVALVAGDERVVDEREADGADEPDRLELLDQVQLDAVDVEPAAEPSEPVEEDDAPEAEPREPRTAPPSQPRVAEPPPAEAALAEAERLVADGDSRAAMDAYRRALVLEPGMAAARVGYARILAGAGRTARAREVLEEGLERQPDHRLLASHMATLAMEAGDRVEARRTLERAVLPEAAGEVEAQLAYLYRTSGHHAAARDLYARLAEAEPDHPRWLTGLGQSAAAEGAREVAVGAWRRLLEIDSLDPDLRRWAQRRLDTLTRD
ncbi:MAG: tetratricopeptide repeat protein [Pseudomonadota bacterium]